MTATPRRLLALTLAAALGLPPGAGPFPARLDLPSRDSRDRAASESAPSAGRCGAASRCCCCSKGAPACRCGGGVPRPGACFEATPGPAAYLIFATHLLKDGKVPASGALHFPPFVEEIAPADRAAVPPPSPTFEVPVPPPRRA